MTRSFPNLRPLGFLVALVALVAPACVAPGDGKQPSADQVYFPVGVMVSEASDHLLVVNSDFDLQFAQGTIQSLRLDRIREVMSKPCSADSDCPVSGVCDQTPGEENGNRPSYFCVDPDDRRPCGSRREKSASELAVNPGRCAPIDLDEPFDSGDSLITDVVETSAFATQAILVTRPCGNGTSLRECASQDEPRVQSRSGTDAPERMFLPVRGDTTIHYVEVEADGRLICGRDIEGSDGSYLDAKGEELRCGSRYRIQDGKTFRVSSDGNLGDDGDEPPDPRQLSEEELDELEDDPFREFRLPPEPLELAANDDGRVIVVSHQQNGRASTLLNNWRDEPSLIHILEGLSSNPIGVAALPSPYGSDDMEPDYLLTYRNDARVELLRFDDDGLLAAGNENPGDLDPDRGIFRPSLNAIGSSPIATNQSGFHSRGVVVDDSARRAAVEACSGDEECVKVAEQVALDVYVANRSPNTLLVGKTGGSDILARITELPRFYDTVPLTAGPSRVQIGNIVGPDGSLEPRVFVLCFDDALIYVYDPVRRIVESELRTGRGPYAIAFDTEKPVAFVAHFTDSYVGAVSLDQRHPLTFGATLATLGLPRPPRASK